MTKVPGAEPGASGESRPDAAETVGAWRRAAASLLREHGFESPGSEADLVAAHVLDIRRIDLTLVADRRLTDEECRRLAELLHQRLLHVPLQYLLGNVDFAGVCLHVGPGVFIPRPETEGLLEHVLRFLKPGTEATVLDVGTGSGALALALAAARPELSIWATDLSPQAIAMAGQNADRLGLGDRVRFFEGDLTLPVRDERSVSPLRVVMSNPPYIALDERKRLAPEIVDHEPHLALFAEDDGMEVIGRLVPQAAELLSAGGLLTLEIGEDQGPRVRALLETAGDWDDIRIERDLTGKDRYALAHRS